MEGDIRKEVQVDITIEPGNPIQLNWPGERNTCHNCQAKNSSTSFYQNLLAVQWPLLHLNPVPPGLVNVTYKRLKGNAHWQSYATEVGVNATEVIHKESLAYRKAQFKRNAR